ncbi:MAG: hypothetical protein ACE15E_13095 [Acidobacteriota bacterium]
MTAVYFALALAGLVVTAEVVLRIPAVTRALPRPEPGLWHSPLVQAKLDYLKKFQAERGIDVLFIGNSSVQAGISPAVFDTALGAQAATRERSFNAAIEGLPPYGVRLFLEIFLRYTHPRAVVYGLTPQDLNSNSPWVEDVSTRIRDSVLAQAESRSGIQGWLYSRLLRVSCLFRYRYLLHQLILRGGRAESEPSVYFDERGFHPMPRRLSELFPTRRTGLFNRAGVLNYSTEGAQLREIERIIEICAARRINLVLVNMPLSDHYYANFDRPADYLAYMNALRQVAQAHALPVWDMEHVSPPDTLTDDDFADFNHLNQWGAARLSELIGRRFRDFAGRQMEWARR